MTHFIILLLLFCKTYGKSVFVGTDQNTGEPLLYTLAPGASSAIPFENPNLTTGGLSATAHIPDGSAILVGTLGDMTPLIYRLSGDTLDIVPTSLGTGNITKVVVGGNGTAFMAGILTGGTVFGLKLPLEDSEATQITFSPPPASSGSTIQGIAVTPDGTAFFVGVTSVVFPMASSTPFIYRLPFGSTTATAVPISLISQGNLVSAASDQYGRVTIVGSQLNPTASPLILVYSNGVLSQVTNSNGSGSGTLSDVSIAPNGTAFIAGGDSGLNEPILWTVARDATTSNPISLSPTTSGSLVVVDVGLDGTVVTAGQNNMSQGIIYTLSNGSGVATGVSNPLSDAVVFETVAVDQYGFTLLPARLAADNIPIIYTVDRGASSAGLIPVDLPAGTSPFVDVAIQIGPNRPFLR